MRILVTVPHFFRRTASAAYGSEKGDIKSRRTALFSCLAALKQTFGHEQAYTENITLRCNAQISSNIDIVVCTTGDAHLVEQLPSHLYKHHHTNAEPRLLGYECHAVLAEAIDHYDYYCFMEDDLVLKDSLFFWKIKWFSENAGQEAVLQPHRFELTADPPVRKLYIDSRLRDSTISPKFQDRSVRPKISGRVLGQDVGFERVDNPHAGCFFLNNQQMKNWMQQPYFLDRSSGFAGPLESAATLGLMRTFRVYKSIAENAGFLEVHHLDNRYLGTQIRFSPDFNLK